LPSVAARSPAIPTRSRPKADKTACFFMDCFLSGQVYGHSPGLVSPE
jgi:hypothetical protein